MEKFKDYLLALALTICCALFSYLILAFIFWDIGFLILSFNSATIRGGVILIILLTLLVGHTFSRIELSKIICESLKDKG